MSISRFLLADSIEIHGTAKNSDEALRRLAELIVRNPSASKLTEKAVYRGLKDREKIGSTGLGRGVAIPHVASDDVDEFVVGILRLDDPIDFSSIDGKPADLFICIVGPRPQRDKHIKLLSAISKFLSGSGGIDTIRGATDVGVIRDLLVSQVAFEEGPESKERVLFQLFIQNLDYFEDILNLLSSVIPGSISVIETRNAGAYLFSMPLFAAFWTEGASRDGRVILAVVDKQMTNNVIRQIQEITGDPDGQTGILVTVQDLTYVAGSLTF